MKIYDSVARISKHVILSEPFYGFVLMGLTKEVSKRLPTAGVAKMGINHRLLINPEFWESLSDDHRFGLLKHELLHICFFHTTNRVDYSDKNLFNIAADLEINQYIDPAKLPEGGITMDMFQHLELEPMAGTDYYYHKLKEIVEKDPDGGGGDPGPGGEGDEGDGDGSGGYSNDRKGDEQRLRDIYNGMREKDIHGTWNDLEDLNEAERHLLKKQIEHQLKDAVKSMGRGTVPAEMSVIIDNIFEEKPPAFNWKAYFRRFITGNGDIFTKKRRSKPNFRFPDNPGMKIKRKVSVLCGVDTSASVDDSDLVEFFQEMKHIYKCGVDITVIECDAGTYEPYKFTGTWNGEVSGRGGTDFQPVVDFYCQRRKDFSVLIYFTDGECCPPKGLRADDRVLWVHCTGRRINEDLPGFKISMEPYYTHD